MPKNLMLCFDGYHQKSKNLQYPLHGLSALLDKSENQHVYYHQLGKSDLHHEDFSRALLAAVNFLSKNYAPGDEIFIFASGNGIRIVEDLSSFISTYGLFIGNKERTKVLAERYNRTRVSSNSTLHSPAFINRIAKGTIKPNVSFIGCIFIDYPNPSTFQEPVTLTMRRDTQKTYIFVTGAKHTETSNLIFTEDLAHALAALEREALSKKALINPQANPHGFFGETTSLLKTTEMRKKKHCVIL